MSEVTFNQEMERWLLKQAAQADDEADLFDAAGMNADAEACRHNARACRLRAEKISNPDHFAE